MTGQFNFNKLCIHLYAKTMIFFYLLNFASVPQAECRHLCRPGNLNMIFLFVGLSVRPSKVQPSLTFR